MQATELSRNFETVTEQPGQGASQLQLEMMVARYAWGRQFAAEKDVLEVACGSGTGLGILAEVARSVAASDVDPANLRAALRTYASDSNVRVQYADAAALPYPDAAFDAVLLFEALYYLPDVRRFFAEARRVLRPGGRLLIATVNREWQGFNPSPFSVYYYSANELNATLKQAGFQVSLHAGFPEEGGPLMSIASAIRKVAVAFHLVPRTMAGKTFLKRLFYGTLKPIPARLGLRGIPSAPLRPVDEFLDLAHYRVLYAEARL